MGTSPVVYGLAAATFWWTWPLAAQEPTKEGKGPVWTLEGVRASQCIRFLMHPAVATKEFRSKARALRADQDQTLHPALRSVLEGQPDFAGWAPAAVCLFYADAIRVGGRRFGGNDPRRSQLLGLWTVAATEPGGARRDMVLDLFGTGGLVRAAKLGGVKIREARSAISRQDGDENQLYEVVLGKTRVVWNGRAAGDSSAVERPIQEFWLTRGASGTLWRLQATLRPAWTRALAGSLNVEGKGELADALKGSPTRFVGPLYYGGGGELRFTR